MKKILLACLLPLALQGCIFVAGAAVGAATIAVVNDHRTIEKISEDNHLANFLADKMQRDSDLHDQTHINVSVFDQIVLLTGEAPNEGLRNKAGDVAQSIPDVKHVYNQIVLTVPSSDLSRANDGWITTKIKTQMVGESDLKSGSIKVITEAGTVFLMGTVTHGQADIAVDIARHTTGVNKVVKVFEYRT